MHMRSWAIMCCTSVIMLMGVGGFGLGCSDDPLQFAPRGSGGMGGCAPSQTVCGDICIDTAVDSMHCGSCDTACQPDQVCSLGMCSSTCDGNTTQCGGSCIDLSKDPAHCGNCDKVCAANENCVSGVCTVVCMGETIHCGNTCVDTMTNSSHCGDCGTVCAANENCEAGVCTVQCTGGTTNCGNTCVDTMTDSSHCGGCGLGCAASEDCVAGACTLVCMGGTTNCGNTCVDTMTDLAHCGVCDNACAVDEKCMAGVCTVQCMGGTTNCSNTCVNTMADSYHCGACGKICALGVPCSAGTCVYGPITYVKASNTGAFDNFGISTVISADGNTMAVGSWNESSNATGINGAQNNNFFTNSGAVYVFVRNAMGAWSQQAYIKASNTSIDDQFGTSVALSADGGTLVVGAPGEDSSAIGINGNQADDTASGAGAVYVFTRNGMNVWSQQAYVKASNGGASDGFGSRVAVSGDGSIMAVNALGESSNAIGINGNQGNNAALNSGAVYVFSRDAMAVWSQQAYVKASNTGAEDRFGSALSLSIDGATLAVGAMYEDSTATGINGNEADNTGFNHGAAYVFTRTGAMWSQQAYVKASNASAGDEFASTLALSGDGNTLAVGAVSEDSSATGINGNEALNGFFSAGAAYVFARNGTIWSQQAYVKASNTASGDTLGTTVTLSGDGNVLAVGASGEDSNATGINGNQGDNSLSVSGAVYLYMRNGMTWAQHAYIKAPNPDVGDNLGENAISLSGDGRTLAVSSITEDSGAMGINGNKADNSVGQSGAVYLYQF